ncbi:MAG: 23S rRNA (uracil(1939)-C(5))-methyltransferase RlmD [Candidatus Saccharimonadales bacterium]
MVKKSYPQETIRLEKIVGDGQTIATLDSGKKIFVWGGLPGELVKVQITKNKSKMAEGVVAEILEPSNNRLEPIDKDSYISTSPWQIMDFDLEQKSKAELIKEAFDLHKIDLPNEINIYSDNNIYNYRNKMEFGWYWNKETNQLDLSFFRRGTHGKIPVEKSELAKDFINQSAIKIRDFLRRKNVNGFMLKTLLIRCNQKDEVIAQLYVKDLNFPKFNNIEIEKFNLIGFEIIFSNPNSPASAITKRLQSWGENKLVDNLFDINFNYTADSFFQINLPVYKKALDDIKKFIDKNKQTIDLYSGVGTIGITTAKQNIKLIEINEQAAGEAKQNVILNNIKNAEVIISSSEKVLDYIDKDSNIVIDPPRAGIHENLIKRFNQVKPLKIIYLSCNPVTQARDVKLLSENYKIIYHNGYNFFPRTPHIEHLVVLELLPSSN